jgi:hypothetical protein
VKRLYILLCVVVLVAAGCARAPQRAEPSLADRLAPAAERFVEQGDYFAAAQLYLNAAETAPQAQRPGLRLHAGEYLSGGELWEELGGLLTGIDPGRLDPLEQARFQVLAAEVLVSRQQPEPALQRLSTISNPEVLPDQGQRYYQVRARAYAMQGNALEAARQLLRLDGIIRDPGQRLDNQYRIWEYLSTLSTPALKQLQTSPPPDPLSGWIELILISRDTRGEPRRWNDALYDWRARYPAHPAEAALLPDLFKKVEQAGERPEHIAVLLPLTGRAAESARAIRDGVLAAYYQDHAARPELYFYDTGEGGRRVWAVYHEAVQNGAEFVIGPLLKQGVEQLAAFPDLPVPVLALNQIEARRSTEATTAPIATAAADNPGHPAGDPTDTAAAGSTPAPPLDAPVRDQPLYQFGLAPEDEARQTAERLFNEGRRHVIALVPDTAWGERVLAAFREHFTALGGTVLETGRYPPDSADFKEPMQEILNLDDSAQRHRALERRLGQNLEYEARRRQDVEAFFVLGFPERVRLIRPQLRFHRAGDIPVFSTSHVYTASPNPAMDRDMDGLYFCDMPWVLDEEGDWAAKRKRLSALWPERSQRYQRLFALGVDAYDVIPRLNTLSLPGFGAFPGATGVLSLDHDDTLHRALEWAQFRDGLPHRLADGSQPLSMEGQNEPQGHGGPR